MTCKHIELLISYKHLEEGRRILDITTVRKASSYWARRIGHIYGLKININLVVTHNGFMSLVKILLLAISLTVKHRILKGHVAVYDIRIVIEFMIKDV
jgi:hypothetical protein